MKQHLPPNAGQEQFEIRIGHHSSLHDFREQGVLQRRRIEHENADRQSSEILTVQCRIAQTQYEFIRQSFGGRRPSRRREPGSGFGEVNSPPSRQTFRRLSGAKQNGDCGVNVIIPAECRTG
jgi:hypothetical protein